MKMTIHRALSELKTIDDRIQKAVDSIRPVGLYQKDKKVAMLYNLDEFEKNAKADYQSITDLIARKAKLKNLIVASNAATKVTVNGAEMTVADAIVQKAYVQNKKGLIEALSSVYRAHLAKMNSENEKVQSSAQKLLETTLGTADAVKNATKETIDNIQTPYLERNTVLMADPLKIESVIKSLIAEVNGFETEVDAVLSESNSITFIEI